MGIIVGSFLSWVSTPFHSYAGFEGAGRFTFYLGVIVLGAAFLPLTRVAGIQAGLAVAATAVLGAWQVIHLISLVGFAGWVPGPGLILVLLSAAIGLVCAQRMLSSNPRPAVATP